jgi:TPR repeat protein
LAAFQGSILVASAAGIAFAIASVENPLALFSNAKASLIGAAPAQSSATAASASEPVVAARAVAAQPAPASQSTAVIGASPPSAPTRDEIALALKAAAHQSQPEIRQPAAVAGAPPPPPPPPARRLDAEELATLLKRARSLIEIGDIAPARLLLERAADAHEASAALMLAQTYDPAVLGTPDTRSITPDPAKAREWYRKAAQFGSQDARQRLSQIQN